MSKRYSVPCWNCDEGFVEPCDELGSDQCCVCYGKGFLIVTELTDDNCEEAVEITSHAGPSRDMGQHPKCSFLCCDDDAAWSAPADRAEATGSPEFMCEYHFEEYSRFTSRPTPGLDPPRGASPFWRPSIMEMVRQCDMEIRRRDKATMPAPCFAPEHNRHHTPAQRSQREWIRAAFRRHANGE